MAQTVFFSATVQKSPMSIPARVMTEHSLDRVVYFVLRGGTDEQRSALAEFLAQSLLTRVPLKRARNREMWICRTHDGCNDAEHFDSYDSILRHVFGEKCRVRVRILWGYPSATRQSCGGESGDQGCLNGSIGTSPCNPCVEREWKGGNNG